MGEEFNWDWFIHNIWERENAEGLLKKEGKGGYSNGRYHPYQATNGIDVGPGFALEHQSEAFRKKAYSTGFTKEELDDSLKVKLQPELNVIDRKVRKLGGNPSRVTNEVKAGLLDIYHQRKNGLYSEFPKLWDAVVKGDYEGMQRESRTTYPDKKGEKQIDKGRWEYRKNTYFKTPEVQRPSFGEINIPSHVEAPDALRVQRATIAMPVKRMKAYGGSLNDYWNNLPMKEKAEMMRVAISNGITTLPEIKEAYNKFAEGGAKDKWTMEDEAGYRHWRQNLPKNLRDTNDRDYDMRAAYKAGMQPEWNDEDKSYHLATRDPKTGRILKSPLHPTFLKGLLTDASLGYYPTMDSKGNIYTKTWPGNMYAQGGKKGSNSEDNVQRAMGYLMSRGMSRTGAAAIVGTLQAESSLDPTIHAKMKGDTGEGLAQWTGSRKKNFWKTLESIEPGAQKKYGSIDRVPMERQLDVVLAERPDVTNAIHNAKDVNTATDIMLRGYENGGGAVGSMASREQMDKIYGKWNNGYNNQMKKRLGYASSILGLNVSPLDYEISQDYFNNMSKQIDDIALSQMSQLSSQQDIDPEFRYKPPVIDWASMKEEKQTQQKLEIPDDGKDNLNRLMGVLGAIGYNDPLLNNIKTIQDNPLMAVANMYS